MIRLYQTSYACPEQYSAFLDGRQVGYLRLRGGYFSVSCPDHGGMKMYEAQPRGDGIFDDSERDFYLRRAVVAMVIWNCQPGIDPWTMPYEVLECGPPSETDDA